MPEQTGQDIGDVDDHWEPEPSGFARFVEWQRQDLAHIFAILGVVVFVLGWAGIVYLLVADNGVVNFGDGGTPSKVYFLLGTGPSVILASGLLWGVAAILTLRRPAPPADD